MKPDMESERRAGPARYEYKFVEVPVKIGAGFRAASGETFEECKKIIASEAGNGWRFKQIVTPFSEKIHVYGVMGYQIIFEKEL